MGSVVLALVDIARPRQYLKQVKMLEMNIDTLLQAAEYIERREREAEHGYASTLPTSQSQIIVTTKNQRLKTSSTKKGTGSRYLRRRLELLSEEVGVDIHKRRSISESSSSSLSSIQSSNSETDV